VTEGVTTVVKLLGDNRFMIMHYRTEVVAGSQVVYFVWISFVELLPMFRPDVVLPDSDLLVPVLPGLLLPEAECVPHLVDDDT
jgi:hypothetical protein